jgi:membrane-associated protein
VSLDLTALLGAVHGPWVYVVVVLAAALESAAFVGLLVPGETVMILAGAVAALGGADVVGVAVAAGAGAIAGDQTGYLLGRTVGDARRERWERSPGWARAEALVARRGGPAVFLARWVGVLRAVVPAVAGAVGMPRRTFSVWNVVGGVSWATTVVLVGFLAGSAGPTVVGWFGTVGTLLMVAAAVALVVARIVRRRHARPAGPTPVTTA